MKRIQLVILVLVLPVIAEICFSCYPVNPCPKPVYGTFSINDIKLETISFAQNLPVVSSDSVFPKNTFGLKVNFIQKVVSHFVEPRHAISFISSSYALSCIGTQMTGVDNISSIKIVTVNAFDNVHAAMSDITSYFKVSSEYDNSALQDLNPALIDKMNYLDFKKDVSAFSNLRLSQNPASAGLHQFKLICTFNSGKIETYLSPIIRLFN
jgi:hypothetical protein